MDFDAKTIGLIAGAAAVMFYPQIMSFLSSLKAKATPESVSPSMPKSRPVGSEPSDWIVDLYSLQKVLIANGQKDAADLLSQAMTKIIGAPVAPRSNGGAKK